MNVFNERYGTSYSIKDIKTYSVSECLSKEEAINMIAIYSEEGIYNHVKPLKDAQSVLQKLKKAGHEVYIVTHSIPSIFAEKVEWIKYHFNIDEAHIVAMQNKWLFKCDIMIEDNLDNLLGGHHYDRIVVDCPWNRNIHDEAYGIYRCNNWNEIISAVNKICNQEWCELDVRDWLGQDNQLGIDIWEKKYKNENETFDEWLDRVSAGDDDVKELIKSKKFLFGGRILANRGLNKDGHKVTYSNCYVITPPEDSIESIFECAAKLARTFSYGGGCGIDISKLAPCGAKVNNTAKSTSGAVSFMDLYSSITGLIGQNGRRGALMISMDCQHPDIENFIEIKNDLDKVTNANISIRFTDEFMNAVVNDEDFELSFTRPETGETIAKTINAREVFKKLSDNNWSMGEPGCLFWDRICDYNLLTNTEEFEYAGTNPCAEEPLPSGGSCLLGSINLAEFVTADKQIDYESLKHTVKVAIWALNDVLNEGLPLHPLEEQRKSVGDWRQIGLTYQVN